MADFDDAERHAIHEVEPNDQLAWLLEEVDDDLVFFGWQQTQLSPPPGVPQLRCDCVAGLKSRSGRQPPWACLIEAQGQPLPRMGIWMMIYLGLLHNVLRYEGQDFFQMMGVILNLSEGELTHTVLWPVPLRKKPAEPTAEGANVGPPAAQPAAEGDKTKQPTAQPAPAPGVSCVFFTKNVRQESAEKTLDRIDRGELGLCILVWILLLRPTFLKTQGDAGLHDKRGQRPGWCPGSVMAWSTAANSSSTSAGQTLQSLPYLAQLHPLVRVGIRVVGWEVLDHHLRVPHQPGLDHPGLAVDVGRSAPSSRFSLRTPPGSPPRVSSAGSMRSTGSNGRDTIG
jgi:hypothetical protein